MRTLVHLSDLHFGQIDEALIGPLTAFIENLKPDAVVISGDLTQRARTGQFREARRFLDTLPRPQIIVPGNHDIPLYNVVRRFVRPLEKYQRYITSDLEPFYVDDEIAVIGVNTARSLTFKDGRVNDIQLEGVRVRLGALPDHITKIVVTHHPFDLPLRLGAKNLVGRAPLAMNLFSSCRIDMLLAGHLHASHAGSTTERYKVGNYSAIGVQAGTATSTRGRGEANAFNIIRINVGRITVDHMNWTPDSGTFVCATTGVFEPTPNGWARAGDPS
jgi:3',5'-cyclic AMP phosphodiesterase CpdA